MNSQLAKQIERWRVAFGDGSYAVQKMAQETLDLRDEVERLTMVVDDLNRLGGGVYDAGLEAALRIAEKMLRECRGSFSIPDAIRAEIKGQIDDKGMGST